MVRFSLHHKFEVKQKDIYFLRCSFDVMFFHSYKFGVLNNVSKFCLSHTENFVFGILLDFILIFPNPNGRVSLLAMFPYKLVTFPCLHAALNDRLRDEVQQLKIATGQVNANNSGKMGKFGLSSYGVDSQSYQRSTQMQSLQAAQQLQQLQIRSQHQQPQMHMQQQHLGTVRQHQLRQDALPFPGDLKMKGIAMTSHVQHHAGAFDGHARNEP